MLSLYQWAVHHHPTHHGTTAGHAVVWPQLLDQQAVASLIHLGWVENPAVAQFSWARYTRYCALLHAWADQANVAAELIEMWLVTRWRDRTEHHSDHADQHPPLSEDSSVRVEWALMEALDAHGGPVATAQMRWLVLSEHADRDITVDVGWAHPGAPDPFV